MNHDKIFEEQNPENWRHDVHVFWILTQPYLTRLSAVVLLSLALSGINGAIAWFIKPALDYIFIERNKTFLLYLPIGIVLIFIARGVFTYAANYLMSSIGARIVQALRAQIYTKLLTVPQSFYSGTSSGSLVSKTLNDVEILQQIVAYTTKDYFVSGSTVIVLAAVALFRKWDLALLSFVVIPLIVYSIGRLGIRMKRTSKETRKLISRVTILLHESLQAMKIIKAFTLEGKMRSKYETALSDHYRNIMREIRIKELSAFVAEVLGGVGVAIIIFYGGHLVISGDISPGAFFSFITALLMIYTPLKRLSRAHNNFQQARTVLKRIRDIIVIEPEKAGGLERNIEGHIEFIDVSFRYPNSREYALNNISLDIRQGELIALVGHSGAGKSTLVDLVAGFWYPGEGTLRIDGVDIRELSLKSLREQIGLVTQDVVLFNSTVRENILMGRPDATDEEVREAARKSYAHEFITALPEGYDSLVGERGAKLSGGQKQRLTIARAILRNPRIMIFDEATSSLDTDSEIKIQKAIESIIPGRTTIIIAHRLSTVRKADRILVMDDGRIIQEGRHEELLARGGMYREVYDMQFGLQSKDRERIN